MMFSHQLLLPVLVLQFAVCLTESVALNTEDGVQDHRGLQATGKASGHRLWYPRIQATFDGINLQRCYKRQAPPRTNSSCSKKAKTCFFGHQECPGLDSHPDTKCFCSGDGTTSGIWTCEPERCPQAEIGNVDHCGCNACTCCCVSQNCGCCNECDNAVLQAHNAFLDATIQIEQPPAQVGDAVDNAHCGCNACTCCCVSQTCSCCNECDNVVLQAHNAFLDATIQIEAPPVPLVDAVDSAQCGCNACTCCCVSQTCSCCNECNSAVLQAHNDFFNIVFPVDELPAPVVDAVVSAHCGCNACTCCCISQTCSCCNECDNAAFQAHTDFLSTITPVDELLNQVADAPLT